MCLCFFPRLTLQYLSNCEKILLHRAIFIHFIIGTFSNYSLQTVTKAVTSRRQNFTSMCV